MSNQEPDPRRERSTPEAKTPARPRGARKPPEQPSPSPSPNDPCAKFPADPKCTAPVGPAGGDDLSDPDARGV